MSFHADTMVGLLPAIHRTRDTGGVLRALLTVIAEQVAGIEENIEQLYDDQFIETCAPWVVPYLADLIGYRPLEVSLQGPPGSARAEVANTIRLRRRKGTAAALEELATTITDWDAAVVEFFLRLATTQYLNHVRPDHPGTADLRRAGQLETVGTPFDRQPYTVDVRRIASARGRHNIPNVGIFLWRIGSRTLTDSPAFQVDARRYLFHPLGADAPLFNAAERATDVTRLADRLTVPAPISRRFLRDNLIRLYGPGRSFTIQVGGTVLDADDIESCDLSDTGLDPQTSAWAHDGQDKVAVDPVLGRIMLPEASAEPVRVTYHYGSVADLGGGEYDRPASVETRPDPVAEVPAGAPGIGPALATLAGTGTVEITGSGRYAETPAIVVAADRILSVRAAGASRPLVQLSGDLVISGGDSGEVVLDGLLIAGGRLFVPAQVGGQPNRLQRLRLVHCTLVPGGGLTRGGGPGPAAVSLEIGAPGVELRIERSIVGGLRVAPLSRTTIVDSIVDGLAPEGVAYAAPGPGGPGGALTVGATTLIGKVHSTLLTASDSILDARLDPAGDTWPAPVIAQRRQTGYVRYSYVPPDGQLPPRYATQHVAPRFTSRRYGHPGYGQLTAGCAGEIRRGASDGGEMGALHHLYAPQREASLRVRLDEYLRFGLEAGLFFTS